MGITAELAQFTADIRLDRLPEDVVRRARFLVLAWLLKRYGEEIRHFIEKRLGQVAGVIVVAIILLFVGARFL